MKISINKTIVVNGRKYASPEEMPEELRRTYEKTMTSGGLGHLTSESGVKARISFNGKEFASIDSMPPHLRKLYEFAMAAAGTEATPPPEPPAGIAAPKGVVEKDGVFVKVAATPEEILQKLSEQKSLKQQISSQVRRLGLAFLGLVAFAVLVLLLRR